MTRTIRTGLGLMATAALLSGCVMAPQPETVTLPNPFAALNGILTPAPQTYTAAPSGAIYRPAPASYGTYTQGAPSYTVPASSYAPLIQEYQAANAGMSLPASTVVQSAPYTLGSVEAVPATTIETVATPMPSYTLGAPASSYTTSAPASSYTMSAPEPAYTMSVPAASSTYAIESTPMAAPVQSMPTFGTVQAAPPVQASGTTYDLTVDGGYGASITPAPQYGADASMGGAFQVVTPTLPSTGGGVATYSAPAISGGTLSY